ncbi:epoxyqueuosine reductase QueH [Candidatus Saccharibacteria bacterium]|nr:epoxyqueuosine reductase QueH [Candidatus Saccharibacteria bacterium]
MRLLLHTCCAPCSVYPIKVLRGEGHETTLFWYNPNIHPYLEYITRRDCLKKYAEDIGVELILEDEYGLDKFVCNVNTDKGNLLRRCEEYCYPLRLGKVFEYAKENGFDAVSTTLLYSVYQKHDIIKGMMEDLAKEYGVKFLYRDFREGWKEGQEEARKIGLYMQKYCGCVYSEEEGMIGRKMGRKLKKAGIAPTNENIRKYVLGNQFASQIVFHGAAPQKRE